MSGVKTAPGWVSVCQAPLLCKVPAWQMHLDPPHTPLASDRPALDKWHTCLAKSDQLKSCHMCSLQTCRCASQMAPIRWCSLDSQLNVEMALVVAQLALRGGFVSFFRSPYPV